MHTFDHLFLHQLRDVYNAEKQLVEALPKMAKAASSDELSSAFEHHLEQTQGHVQRLEKIFKDLGEDSKGETCEAMQGLIKEGEEIIKSDGDAHVKDAGLIAAAQRVEHYEIASYGTLCTYASQLSHQKAHELLNETLHEEKETDSKLNKIALESINQKAKNS